jgi:hypothetical protein
MSAKKKERMYILPDSRHAWLTTEERTIADNRPFTFRFDAVSVYCLID